jgi:hypothetical protein
VAVATPSMPVAPAITTGSPLAMCHDRARLS